MLQYLLRNIIIIIYRFKSVQTKVPGSMGPEPWEFKVQ